MPIARELNIQLENRPGALAKVCQALAGRNLNIVAFQVSTVERRSQIHLVVDNPGAAKMVLAAEGLVYTEGDVVQVALRNLPGELARVTSRLAEANININYAYGGSSLLFFGVAEVGRAAKILDQAAATATSAFRN
jgi:hypothetical protein